MRFTIRSLSLSSASSSDDNDTPFPSFAMPHTDTVTQYLQSASHTFREQFQELYPSVTLGEDEVPEVIDTEITKQKAFYMFALSNILGNLGYYYYY